MKEFKKIRPIKDGTYLCFVYIYRLAAYKLELLEFNNGKISYNEYEKEIIGWEEIFYLSDEDKIQIFKNYEIDIKKAFDEEELSFSEIEICHSFFEMLYKYEGFYFDNQVKRINDFFVIRIL